jgi:SAM-dependent methyltransferase
MTISTANIEFDHSRNPYAIETPRVTLPLIFSDWKPKSLLDIGCGVGTWLKAADEFGIPTLQGVDGTSVSAEQFLVRPEFFSLHDLTTRLNLGRKFDAVLCLEVGEHLEARHAETLVHSVTTHSDFVVFSAACPGQPGQHHVNCQWPAYWQQHFNNAGFVCIDSIRWRLWNISEIQPWYRQNIFLARHDPPHSGKEPRIEPVVHPEMLPLLMQEACALHRHEIGRGVLPAKWYLTTPARALFAKLGLRFPHR